MKFHAAAPEFGLPVRLVSEGGGWEVGFTPATFGRWQVTLGMVDCMGIELRYCCGHDRALRLEVLLLVLGIFAPVEEAQLCPEFIRRTFPGWTQRPIDLCPMCLPRLRELARQAECSGPERVRSDA